MYYDEDDEARRPQVSHLRRLLDLTEAKEAFISVRQLERFYKRPDGPRVPTECLEVRPFLPRGILSCHELSKVDIWDVMITEQGELCCLFKQGNTYKVSCGDRVFVVAKSLEPGSDFGIVPSLQGTHDGQPVTRVSCITLDLQDRSPPEWISFKLGKEECYSAKDGEESHLLLANGMMLCAKRLISDGYDILVGGHAVGSCAFVPRFFQGSAGEVHVFCYDATRKVSIWWTLDRQDKLEYKDTQIEGLVETPDGVMAVTYLREGTRRIIRRDKRMLTDCPSYASNFQVLPGQFVYAASRQGGGQSLVAGKRCQPSFDRVSPAFERDGQWLYYGVTGGHIYTMEVPEAI